jgi:2-phosphosulfolactate phosphatase
MQIDIQLLPFHLEVHLISRRVVVVIDVLRATSVMVHALSQGAREIIPVQTIEEAFELVRSYPPHSTLLGGERGSRRIEGFDLGNSPREYVGEKVKGKRLILTTTNGTKAFHAVSSAGKALVGSFFNTTAVAEKCLQVDQDLLIYPSGDEGHFSLEDTVCGGMVIDHLIRKGGDSIRLTDGANAAYYLYQQFKQNLVEALRLSNHGKDLIAKGLEEDLLYCAQVDRTDVVPVFREGVIRPG